MSAVMLRRVFVMSVIVSGLCIAGLTPPVVEAKGSKGNSVEGIIAQVDLSSGIVTIATRSGDVVVATNAATKIERNDRKVTLDAIRVGDRAEAKFASATNRVAVKLEAEGAK